ncbi:hypothetical protein L6164_014589 [Bauhinia variegata]|uniref:Uncharacterized protein n=1 Tax=Bauhinia variegata TaxID=167791 RepID=A0ACB9NI06_BAUVA|nr:hypothetical protein L6164_014589 [Bauhinia variegata]
MTERNRVQLATRSVGSEAKHPLVWWVNMLEEKSENSSCPGKKIQAKVPKRIHKAEREKVKREHLNELFVDLANALELSQQNSGKASILCEATRLLKDLLGQIEFLKKENESLLSESHYVSMEKNELKEESSTLETQIEKLQGEIQARVAQSKPDLNVLPTLEPEPPEQTTNFVGERLPSSLEPTMQQGSAFLVVPFRPRLQSAFSAPNAAELSLKSSSNISKPHARYPTPADSWPSQLLGEQPTSS